MSDASPRSASSAGLLDVIERIGNRLPDPATLFLIGTIAVMVLSAIAATAEWEVQPKLPVPVTETVTGPDGAPVEQAVLDESGAPVLEWRESGEPLRATSLLTRDGIFWLLSSLVDNFMEFPPLGVVLVGMLGIGVAERTGLLGALLKAFMLVVPGRLLTPAMVFIGIMSSMTLDAGYVVLPPLAGLLYASVGRSPLAGIAAVFAGVSAGFNANLFITGLDPMLAGLATTGGQVIDPDYEMSAPCNWYFMIASTFVITFAGWAVTAFFVERRLQDKPEDEGGPPLSTDVAKDEQRLTADEKRAMNWAGGSFALVLGAFIAMIVVPGGPLHGEGEAFDRWVESIVPMLFFCFVIPGAVYGVVIGSIRSDKDVAKLLTESMAGMAPIIVLAFFAAQFIQCFSYSGLDRMLAMAGGQALGQAEMPAWVLIVAFILLTVVFNLFIGSMSAKYAMFAPIFIPMFMLVGISPELTQAAYRIGDSVSNIITPLNAYLVIILVFMQKYVPKGGMGTLISTMMPYTIVFTIVWTIMLLIWMALGIPLGPDGPLTWDVTAVAP
ncbi:MAG: AbgT family transporter [Planctomycetota bacterium]|jgi:aminobenzoyl-glutamate transport protein